MKMEMFLFTTCECLLRRTGLMTVADLVGVDLIDILLGLSI